jgi:hypothetical protein
MDKMSEEDTDTQKLVEKSSLAEPPSCPNDAPDTTSDPPPQGVTSAEVVPLQSDKPQNITTVKVGKCSSNVEINETSKTTAYPVYVKSLVEAEDVLHRFEKETKHRYTVWRCPRDFGNSRKQCMVVHLPPLVCCLTAVHNMKCYA